MKAILPLLFLLVMLPSPVSGNADGVASDSPTEYASTTALDPGAMTMAVGGQSAQVTPVPNEESSKPNSALMLALIVALLVLPFVLKSEPSEE